MKYPWAVPGKDVVHIRPEPWFIEGTHDVYKPSPEFMQTYHIVYRKSGGPWGDDPDMIGIVLEGLGSACWRIESRNGLNFAPVTEVTIGKELEAVT